MVKVQEESLFPIKKSEIIFSGNNGERDEKNARCLNPWDLSFLLTTVAWSNESRGSVKHSSHDEGLEHKHTYIHHPAPMSPWHCPRSDLKRAFSHKASQPLSAVETVAKVS